MTSYSLWAHTYKIITHTLFGFSQFFDTLIVVEPYRNWYHSKADTLGFNLIYSMSIYVDKELSNKETGTTNNNPSGKL